MLRDFEELAGCRVLLADGSSAVLSLLKDLFHWVGARAVSVSRGEAALEAFLGGTFDLLVLDLEIPGINAEEVLRILRENQPDMFARTLLISGDRHQSARCLARWGLHPLDKPFSLEDLCITCCKLLSSQTRGIAS